MRELLTLEGREGVLVQVDGGVGTETVGPLAAAGADVMVAGSAVFGHPEGAGPGIRITSYNVCYTKLLRDALALPPGAASPGEPGSHVASGPRGGSGSGGSG